MSIFDFLTLFGGLAMFLYGMRLMGDGLKESSSGTLKKAMESVTNNQFKAFLLGLGITAIIQSSTATIVITSGLVGAGLLTLHQSIGIITSVLPLRARSSDFWIWTQEAEPPPGCNFSNRRLWRPSR